MNELCKAILYTMTQSSVITYHNNTQVHVGRPLELLHSLLMSAIAVQHIPCTQGATTLATVRVWPRRVSNSASSYSTVRSRSALQPQDIRKVFTDTRSSVAVLA
eukprot:14675-Heterococcus_DN1.PRE.19